MKTARSVTYDILREILREARQFNPREYRIVAAPHGVAGAKHSAMPLKERPRVGEIAGVLGHKLDG